MAQSKANQAIVVRNFIFGVEDSLVSTVGLLSGIAVAGVARETILITGLILICVEAFSMAMGSFLSEEASEEFQHQTSGEFAHSLKAGVVMFVSYFVSGFIPLSPYLFPFAGDKLLLSIGLSLLALILLGVVSGKLFGVSKTRNALRMFVLGGIAIAAGVLVGRLLPPL